MSRHTVPLSDDGWIRMRTLGIIGLTLLWSLLATTPARAQQGYEFGIRFRPVQFQPLNFRGFSFPQQSFRPQLDQPIQFRTITFPALNSRTYRGRQNEASATPPTPRVDLPLQFDTPPAYAIRTRRATGRRGINRQWASRSSDFTRPDFLVGTRTQPVERRLAQSSRERILGAPVPRLANNLAPPNNPRRLASSSRPLFTEPIRTARRIPPPSGPRAAFAPQAATRIR